MSGYDRFDKHNHDDYPRTVSQIGTLTLTSEPVLVYRCGRCGTIVEFPLAYQTTLIKGENK